MVRWGMAVDLTRCAGCQTCTIACKIDNETPPNVFWKSVRDVEIGSYPEVKRFFLPVQCMHCADPPCMDVCPTGATKKRDDGVVFIDYERCMGCGYCVLACPYEARSLVKDERSYFDGDGQRAAGPRPLGATTKCDLCFDRLDAGLGAGKRPGLDPEATPVCVNTCPARAVVFGDLDDPGSEVSKIVRTRESFRLLPHMGTDPSVYYLW